MNTEQKLKLGLLEAAFKARGITPAEVKVAVLYSLGLTGQEVAEKVGLHIKTVKNHLTSVYKKNGIKNKTDLAIMAQHVMNGRAYKLVVCDEFSGVNEGSLKGPETDLAGSPLNYSYNRKNGRGNKNNATRRL